MTFFNELTFFNADINQSEVEDSFQLASDWIKSVQENVTKSTVVTSHFWLVNVCIKECEFIKEGHTFRLLAVK